MDPNTLPTWTMNFAPLLNVLLPLMLAAVTAAIPVIVTAVLTRLGVANNTDLAAKLNAVAIEAAGVAYNYALSRANGLSEVQVYDSALTEGMNYVINHAPDVLQKLGVTPDEVKTQVAAQLGVLLATDPSVSAGRPPAGVVKPA